MEPQSHPYVEIGVPLVSTERVFLQLAVHAAVRKFRAMQADLASPASPGSTIIVVSDRELNNEPSPSN
jgi:hypothetical protein